jgi:hypothetical protein
MITYVLYRDGGRKIGEIQRKKPFRQRYRRGKKIRIGRRIYKVLRATRKDIVLLLMEENRLLPKEKRVSAIAYVKRVRFARK